VGVLPPVDRRDIDLEKVGELLVGGAEQAQL
jgi:hypothetical protein